MLKRLAQLLIRKPITITDATNAQEGGENEFLSPNEFLIYDEAGSITREDWQDLCSWLVVRGSNDSIVIDVAANGMEDWQLRKEDTDHIQREAGILNIPKKEKLERIELMRIEQYHAKKINFKELVSQMEALWLRHSDYKELEIWFTLSESLGYYDNGQGTLFYKLNKRDLLKSAEEILRKKGKII